MMNIKNMKINNDWDNVLVDVLNSAWFINLMNTVEEEYNNKTIFPLKENIFNSFKLTPFKDVKVVILGQDPYHGENEAHGLSFSVMNNCSMPPSLSNIFKELYNDLGIKRENTDLTDWAKQGVLLLNSILTVEKDKALSHSWIEWEKFTDCVIKELSNRGNVIFVLWGSFARRKRVLINTEKNYIIESVHPSPLSCYRGFFGSKPFSKINKILKEEGFEEIKW